MKENPSLPIVVDQIHFLLLQPACLFTTWHHFSSIHYYFLGLGVGGGGYKFINSPRTLSLKRILDPEKFHLIKTQDFVINEKYLFFICLIFPHGLFKFSAFRLNTFIQLSWISLPTYYYFDCGSCEIYTRST